MRSLRGRWARAGWRLLAVLPVVAGCREGASASPGEGEPAAAAWLEAPAEGFVVLPWGTRVYLEPSFGGPSARLGWPSTPVPPWPATGYVARVVGARDGFVEIAPVMPPAQPHCGPLLDGEAFDVRLYVSPWALAPVLAREVEVRRDDGSVLLLRPGAVAQPIAGDDEERWAVWAGGIRLRAALPEGAVLRSYPEVSPVPMSTSGGWQLPAGQPYAWDGWPIELVQGFGQDVAITSVTAHDDAYLVELTSPCARVVVHGAQPPPSWSEPFPHAVEFGLGGPEGVVPQAVLEAVGLEPPPMPEGEPGGEHVGGVPADAETATAIDLLEPEEPPPGFERATIEGSLSEIDMPGFESDTIEGSLSTVGVLGVLSGFGPARIEHVFEEGAPVYLSLAGPPAGTLAQLRVFTEDGWAAGDRLCFHTSFGSRFDPMLPVCLPAAEARVRNPAVDVHDFGAGVVRPGALRVTGALSEPAVARTLRLHRKDLRRCLNEAMMQGVLPSGGFELTLHVSGQGTVTDARSRSTLAPILTGCAVAAARSWTMPAPSDGKPAKVVLSVRLEPR